ncbi:uncharacterized protein LOC101759015 [Setaria italica]|uniref:Dirigent protein n=2 Tax=Setaria italica TaxID=4555 RepID=K4A075_SETIT|nr:uncharacterized protein LOC101759015 [Setaria italica]
MAASPKLPSNFQIKSFDPSTTIMKKNELKISNLYLHHAYREPSPTHLTLLSPKGQSGFGATVSNNWAIHDGPDLSKDAIVARSQGLHMQSGNWHNSFTIAFEIDGLKDSTLQVMGLGVDKGTDQWSIVGGTGQFTFAQGFINKKLHKVVDTGNIIELDIYAIFQTKYTHTYTRDGPKGGDAGQAREPKYEPHRLETIKIDHGDLIYSIEYSHIDQYGTKHTEGRGTEGSETGIIELGPTEFVHEVSGTLGKCNNIYTVLSSLTIVTNLRTLGPYGKETSESPFSLPEKKGGSVVGFFASTGVAVGALGVIVRQ